MRKRARFVTLSLGGLALLGLLLAYALSAYAAPSCPGNPCVSAVFPAAIPNTENVTITVTGQGFVGPSPIVYLDGMVLSTTLVNATTLTAVVPAGLPGEINGRPYTITVVNGNGNPVPGSLTLLIMRPAPTEAPTGTPTPTAFVRPLITVLAYVPSTRPPLYPGQEFDFAITLQNTGQLAARNVIVFFPAGDVVPRDTGGTRTIGDLAPGGTASFSQPLRVLGNLGGYEAVITVQISYTDEFGSPYSETSVLSFEVRQYGSTPTPTPTLSVRPQVLVEDYSTDPETLSPGTVFTLSVAVVNASGEAARQVVVALELSEASLRSIAPLSTGNVRYIERLAPGERQTLTYQLAVNGDAEGGLVPLNLALAYIDNANVERTDTQIISLPVNAVPHLQVGLFEPLPETILVGDTFDMAVEVINIGAQSVNVSTVELIGDDRLTIRNGSIYVGPLDGGTSGTLIATVTAHQAGTIPLEVRVHYLDSFQQPQTLAETLTIEVEAIPEEELPPGEGEAAPGEGPGNGELSLGERLWRGLLGFLGLGTRDPTATFGGEGVIVEPGGPDR